MGSPAAIDTTGAHPVVEKHAPLRVLFGPEFLAAVPTGEFGTGNSPGAGIGAQGRIFGSRSWLALRFDVGWAQFGSSSSDFRFLDIFGDTLVGTAQTHSQAFWLELGPAFEQHSGISTFYEFGSIGLQTVKPVAEAGFLGLAFLPAKPKSSTGFQFGFGGGYRRSLGFLPHASVGIETDHQFRTGVKRLASPAFEVDPVTQLSHFSTTTTAGNMWSVKLMLLLSPP